MAEISRQDLKEIGQRAYADPVFFCKFFLEHWFPNEVPWVHRGLLAIFTRRTDFLLGYGEIDKIERNFAWKENPSDSNSKLNSIFNVEWRWDSEAEDWTARNVKLKSSAYAMLMMPRGFSKTTLTNAVTLYYILFQESRFTVYLSETASHSEMQLANVKRELEGNERIKAIFGELKPPERQGRKWTGDIFETITDVVVAARGRGAQIRGMQMNARRPDRIIMDDVEDDESVKTEEQRQKTRDWFYKEVLPALPIMDSNATIIALGTLLHIEALLQTLRGDPEWTSVVFGALDVDGEPLWADAMDGDKIERKRQSFARAGQLSSFYMEFFNTPRSEENAKFRQDMIKTWETVGIVGKATDKMNKAIALDPAISQNRKADYSAIGVVGMERGGWIHVLDMWGRVGAPPRELIDKFFAYGKMWNCQQHGVEAIAYQAALVHMLREEMFRKKYYFEVVEIRHSSQQKKTDRVEGILQPRFASGYIYMRQRFETLITQLLDWPNGKKDFPDVLAMCVSLLDPYAAQAADPSTDLEDDEYAPLDKMIGGSWKRAP